MYLGKVNGFKGGAKYKAFKTNEEAEAYVKVNRLPDKNNKNDKSEGDGASKDKNKDKDGGQNGGAGSKVTFGPHTSMVLDGWEDY